MPDLLKKPAVADNSAFGGPSTTQAAAGNAALGVASTAPIDVSKIGNATPFDLPQTPIPSSYDISSLPGIDTLLNPAPTATETDQTKVQGQYLADVKTIGGKKAAQTTAEDTAAKALGATNGLSDFTTQLSDINNQITSLKFENASIPMQVQAAFAGRGVTAGGAAPIQSEQVRNNSIKALGLAAIAQTLQGNIASAQQTASRAVELQFAPVQAEIDYLKEALAINDKKLTHEDAKRAQTLTVQLAERQRLLDQQKADATDVHSVAGTAAKYGATADVINKILASKDYASALSAAGQFTQDPQAKYELESARLDNILKQSQIDKTKAETAQIGQPSAAETKAAAAAAALAKSTIPVLQDKVTLIDSLLNSSGLASSVGPNPFARVPITADITGAGQNFRAGVQQLISQDTLDTLLALKAQGGTLGALSEGEGKMLRQAATKIGSWEITDGPAKGRFNIDEGSFKAELNTIRTLAERAITKAQGNLIAPDEQSALDKLFSGASTTPLPLGNFNPASFYNK